MRAHRGDINTIKTTNIDTETVRFRPRHIEGMDAAMPAEGMLGGIGAEQVGRDRVLAAQQRELLARHDEMQEAFHRADRAIAVCGVRQIALDTESHFAAVAATLTTFAASHPPIALNFPPHAIISRRVCQNGRNASRQAAPRVSPTQAT